MKDVQRIVEKMEYFPLVEVNGKMLSLKVKHFGGKKSMVMERDDSHKYNIVEIKLGDKVRAFEVWGEETANLEHSLYESLDILLGFSSDVIKYDKKDYNLFCERLESDPWEIELGVAFARTLGYIKGLNDLGIEDEQIVELHEALMEVDNLIDFIMYYNKKYKASLYNPEAEDKLDVDYKGCDELIKRVIDSEDVCIIYLDKRNL